MTIVDKVGKKIFELLSKISIKFSAKLLFFIRTKKWPNLKTPKTFNEKTTWLKLNDYNNNELVSKCSDKYEVRNYIEKNGCKEILNDLYGVYDKVNEIKFDDLPQKFALKCTHGCGYNIICLNKDDLDLKMVHHKVSKWLNEKYGLATTELHYTKIKPRIIIERNLCDDNGRLPIDYKLYCMNGKVKGILVCSEREKKLKLNYYDVNWKQLDYVKESWKGSTNIEKPKNLKQMIEYAEKLSQEFPFVRVDFYNDNGKIIFSELTFTPACSCASYYNKNGNKSLGKLLDIENS